MLSLGLSGDVGIRATLFCGWMNLSGEFFYRKLLLSIDQPMSRFLHFAFFPSNGRALRWSLLARSLTLLRVIAWSKIFIFRRLFCSNTFPIGTPFRRTTG
jgi:hypothetical protein